MSTEPVNSNISVAAAGEPTLFDSLARLVPEELQAAYYRVLAHTRKLSPDDEMLRILEAMGILALLTRQTPMEIAEERERIQEMLDLHQQFFRRSTTEDARLCLRVGERIARLPEKIEAGLDAQKIARLLSESLRQSFLESGLPAAARCLQGTSAAMTRAQKELSAALGNLSDSNGGVVAQVEFANNRLTQSLEKRTNALDELLHKLNTHVLYVWIPVISTAALMIGTGCWHEDRRLHGFGSCGGLQRQQRYRLFQRPDHKRIADRLVLQSSNTIVRQKQEQVLSMKR